MDHPSFLRSYARCRFGQMHVTTARPSGAPTAPTLVLLHQNPSSAVEYRGLMEAMATDRIVHAFDTPGHGMSDRPAGPMPIADYAGAFGEALDDLHIGADGPVDVYGFHTGTLLAVELALQRGPRVGRVALTGIPYRPTAERAERLATIHAVAPPTDDGDAIFERLRWLWRFTVAERHAGISIERAAEIFMERAKPLHRYWWPYEGVWTYPIEERFPQVTQPVLVAQPDEMFLDQSRAATALFIDATFMALPALSRDIFEPEAGVGTLAATLRSFLT